MPDRPEITSHALLDTAAVSVRDVQCRGTCRHRSVDECATTTHLVFPYRGVYLRHVGADQAVADSNHVLFFNAGQTYQISHPLTGGDACLSIRIGESALDELAPARLLNRAAALGFRQQQRRVDIRTPARVAMLRRTLEQRTLDPLAAETLALELVRHSLGPRNSSSGRATAARHKLADRVKVLLASAPSRRWTLSQIATQMRCSPVYLTQVFGQTEGLPLYRYQLRLRLARALELLWQYDDIAALAADLGFSSHSHFSAAFRHAYGRTPSQFRQAGRA
jgi:AraC family transcriptional regulator